MKNYQKVFLAVIVAISIASGNVAQAATCSGPACNNTNPQTTGCGSGAFNTRGPASIPLWTVETRYSPTCVTRWARTTLNGYPQSFPIGIFAKITWSGGSSYQTSGNAYNINWQVWSPQKFGLEVVSCGGNNPSTTQLCLPLG
ncbi:MAG: DUF2690 domain-containing protein [Anaerolineae bacterium]|nr:DUF2690 domain-containing protein [Anaerolineae bacterium]